MEDIYYVQDFQQLKALSDPFKVKILWEIDDQAKTGKMLADELQLSTSKVRYHLFELEKVGLIRIEKVEEKNGINQKFYRPVAKVLSLEHMSPYVNKHAFVSREGVRESFMRSLQRTQKYLQQGYGGHPKQLFGDYLLSPEEWDMVCQKWNELYAYVKDKDHQNNNQSNDYAHTHHINAVMFQLEGDKDDSTH